MPPLEDIKDDVLNEAGEAAPGEGEGGDDEIQTYLRDLTEDDVYGRLQQVHDFPSHLNALESRLSGGSAELAKRLEALEKSLPTQASFDTDAISKGLEAYDPKLAEVLVPLLQEAFKTNALDESTLRPHLDPIQQQLKDYMGEQLVMAAYSPEALGEIVPPVKDGRFAPEGQRHKDFIDWYAQQGYGTQQALLSFGAPYINALRQFEKWEKAKNEERAKAADGQNKRLAAGQQPTSQHRRTATEKKQTPEASFLSGFEEASKEMAR